MRQTCLNMVYRAGQARPARRSSSAPISAPICSSGMKEEMPDRWYMEGITEAERDRHGRGVGDGGLYPLRQHHRDLHHPALLRAGRGRSAACTICRCG